MSLARRLRELLDDHDLPAGRAVRAALTEFVAVVRAENADALEAADGPDSADGEDAGGEPVDTGGGLDDEGMDEEGEDEDGEDGDAVGKAAVHPIDCPYCGERIGIAIDLSGEDQDAIQDCEVCCSPIRVVYTVVDGRLGAFSAEPS